jgi:hypothetical protein
MALGRSARFGSADGARLVACSVISEGHPRSTVAEQTYSIRQVRQTMCIKGHATGLEGAPKGNRNRQYFCKLPDAVYWFWWGETDAQPKIALWLIPRRSDIANMRQFIERLHIFFSTVTTLELCSRYLLHWTIIPV